MSLIGAAQVPRQPDLPDQSLSPRNQKKAHALGITSATGLVIGSIVGTGVFTMPAVLAGAGTMSLIVLGVIAVGALLLGVMCGQLSKRVPNRDGGLYAYSRHEFGDCAGYLVGWCYWIQAWAGNAAIVSAGVFYGDALFGINHPSGMQNWGIALVGLWVPAVINLVGARQMAWFQNVTVVLKFLRIADRTDAALHEVHPDAGHTPLSRVGGLERLPAEITDPHICAHEGSALGRHSDPPSSASSGRVRLPIRNGSSALLSPAVYAAAALAKARGVAEARACARCTRKRSVIQRVYRIRDEPGQ
jgi:hypothetical protein